MSSGLVNYRGEMLIRLVLAFVEVGVIRSYNGTNLNSNMEL